ncbi:membrane protein insertase YidC [bacterium]|nr:MAG: membrane protein insertase YidC [bacterium]
MQEDQGKRLLLAIAISFAFLFIYQNYFGPPIQRPEENGQTTTESTEEAPDILDVEVLTPPVQPGAGDTQADLPADSALSLAASEEKPITVQTPLYTAVLTNRGGVLKSFRLRKFVEDMKNPESKVEMVRDAQEVGLPLGAEFVAAGGPLGFRGSLFVIDGENLVLEAGETRSITFRHRTNEGLEMIKSFTFSGDSYVIDKSVRFANRGNETVGGRLILSWIPGLGPKVGEKDTRSLATGRYGYKGALVLEGNKTRKIKSKKLQGTEILEVLPEWIATMDLYFTAVLMPVSGADGALARKHEDGRVEVGLYSQFRLNPGTARDMEINAYVGPKEMATLKAVDPSLAKAIELGIFGFIAKPLLDLLNFFYRYVGNYGVAIIILTILIKIVFIPFSTASHRSMKKMASLQPQINALRDRYKKDKEKLNKEIMALYSENKVNPAGGCVPILVQIPVFFALYRALLGAIELRHAPFIFWITDLSAKDPLYITPIIMGGTMFLQQKMTPMSGDPRQAQIMLFMPIVFTAMFLNLPSGLVLYWTVNNVLTIGHQYYMNKTIKIATPEPEPEKKKGKGKGKK